MGSQPMMVRNARSTAPIRAPAPTHAQDRPWARHGLANQVLQAKLRVGRADDPLEREADRVAERVLGGSPVGPLCSISEHPQRKCAACEVEEKETMQRQVNEDEEEELQLKPDAGGPRASGAEPAASAVAQGGRPLSPAERAYFEPRFGSDFSDVRVHDEPRAHSAAEAINARAFTLGANIAFGTGAYIPGTEKGQRLLAHELAHVVQQAGGGSLGIAAVSNTLVQRQDDGGLAPGGTPTSPESTTSPAETVTELQAPPAPLVEVRPSEGERVRRIVISCTDMRFRLETATTAYIYTLEECSLPLGSYETPVTVTGNDFFLDFGAAVRAEEEFLFRYRVDPGQENPTTLLRDQASVHVDVVDNLPAPRETRLPGEQRTTPECVVRLGDRDLVPADSLNRNLFERIAFSPITIWSHRIPLGQFGWVQVEAKVSGSLSGTFSASYGPGRLTDICLTYLADRQTSTAPIEHPLLGRGSRADVTTYNIGGRARFRLPARAAIRIAGEGRLRIHGDYLDVIEIAAAEGVLSAQGVATLAGEINGGVDVIARATRAAATLEAPILPLRVTIENSTIDAVNLVAEIGLRGRAGVTFRVDLSAGFHLAGIDLWRQKWNLAQFDAGVSWSGGLKYSPNPGIHWDLGTLGVDDEMDRGPAEDEGLEDISFHEDAAEVEEEDIVKAILDENRAQVDSPDGLSEDTALPFDWYKPMELYPEVIYIPNADYPHELSRDVGPTPVYYQVRGRTNEEYLGVADWPDLGKTFEYFPYDKRRTREQRRFNRLLDRLGYRRREEGVDAEHAWDVKLRGLGYDRFDNLWPASNQEQQLAGTRHDRQISNYEDTLGNISGYWFKIVRFRHPA